MILIVYKVTNKYEDKSYIGASEESLSTRKKDHIQKANNASDIKFHNAISTYGEEAFVWETIDTANTADELAHKEKHYIAYYDSKENGYNSDSGGGFQKTVYKYETETGQMTESFECLEDAASTVNATKQQISRACLNVNNLFAGYYWSYEKQDPFIPQEDQRKKGVCQYTLEGELLACFKSIAEASRETGIGKSCIAKVYRNERKVAGNFIWR